ncbi:MAG: thioredoxin domain-containing protein [Candidatus Thorarchaeota archaeon]
MLLFTSDHCTWCNTVKVMIEEESKKFSHPPVVCEINIDYYRNFAEVFGIVMIPTLIYKSHELNGLPDRSDLRSFLLQAISEGCSVKQNPRSIRSSQHVDPQKKPDQAPELVL